jgi:sugar/nucleoside kinase (ribokinase family)
LAVACVRGDDITAAVRFGNAAGALAATGRGAHPSLPRTDDIESLIHGKEGTKR